MLPFGFPRKWRSSSGRAANLSEGKGEHARMADIENATDNGGVEGSAINFAAFIVSLAHTAAVHFGDVPDPITGETSEPNLPAAQQMIEILALLEEKTRGNLTPE